MIRGNEVSFKVAVEGGPAGPMTFTYKGTVDGDQLALTRTFEGTPPEGFAAETAYTATRVK